MNIKEIFEDYDALEREDIPAILYRVRRTKLYLLCKSEKCWVD